MTDSTSDETSEPTTPTPTAPASPPPAKQRGLDPIALSALITGALGLGAIPLSLGIIGRHRAQRNNRDDYGFSTVGIVLGAASMVGWFLVGSFALLSLGAHGHHHWGQHRPAIMHYQEFGPGYDQDRPPFEIYERPHQGEDLGQGPGEGPGTRFGGDTADPQMRMPHHRDQRVTPEQAVPDESPSS